MIALPATHQLKAEKQDDYYVGGTVINLNSTAQDVSDIVDSFIQPRPAYHTLANGTTATAWLISFDREGALFAKEHSPQTPIQELLEYFLWCPMVLTPIWILVSLPGHPLSAAAIADLGRAAMERAYPTEEKEDDAKNDI